ncbi:hypothetical protein H5410_035014 [Solanum commersonii]|uniref:Uncharacterized protein n=1 Tax=Solanum commersonii TaxID=4109 RepID=A0A9J5Y3U7_SOLCO|nr:hypothetical protein H5410_035014 [Solanum commersonii]
MSNQDLQENEATSKEYIDPLQEQIQEIGYTKTLNEHSVETHEKDDASEKVPDGNQIDLNDGQDTEQPNLVIRNSRFGLQKSSSYSKSINLGGKRNQSLRFDLEDETIARSEREQISSKEQAYSSCDDDDDIPLVQIVFKRLCSRLSIISYRPIAMILPDAHDSLTSNPLMKAPVRVTRFVQRTRDAMLLAKSTKKTRPMQCKFIIHSNTIDIDDDDIIEPKKSRKRKRNTSKPDESGPKEIDEINSARALSFRRRSVVRGRVITGFGGDEMSELLALVQAQGWTELLSEGTLRRKMGREETNEFYLNATGSVMSISSTVCGVSFTLNAEILSSILGVPNNGWSHYVKRNWPPLEGNISAFEICHRFSNDPTLTEYTRVDKGAMLPLHRLLLDVMHKIVLPQKQKRTEANYLDLTLMELLLSKIQINLPALILSHIHGLCVFDKKERGLAYGFWLGMVFEHFCVLVREWQIQTIKDVLGVVNHETIPATKRRENEPMQRLRASLTAKTKEITALQDSHSAAIDKLHIDYGLKHARLAEKNSRLTEELAQTQAALNTERLTNSVRLKHVYALLTKDFPSSSSTLPPFV